MFLNGRIWNSQKGNYFIKSSWEKYESNGSAFLTKKNKFDVWKLFLKLFKICFIYLSNWNWKWLNVSVYFSFVHTTKQNSNPKIGWIEYWVAFELVYFIFQLMQIRKLLIFLDRCETRTIPREKHRIHWTSQELIQHTAHMIYRCMTNSTQQGVHTMCKTYFPLFVWRTYTETAADEIGILASRSIRVEQNVEKTIFLELMKEREKRNLAVYKLLTLVSVSFNSSPSPANDIHSKMNEGKNGWIRLFEYLLISSFLSSFRHSIEW